MTDKATRIEETTIDISECLKAAGSDWWDAETMVVDLDGEKSAIEMTSYAGKVYRITIEDC